MGVVSLYSVSNQTHTGNPSEQKNTGLERCRPGPGMFLLSVCGKAITL
jgi:hypothetical protein